MRRTTTTGLALMALAVSAAGAARPARAGSLYTLTDLGTLPGFDSSAGFGVNNRGQVAGYVYTYTNQEGSYHAFLSGHGGGPLKDLGTLGGTTSVGLGVNDSGQVAGWSYTASGFPRAFVYTGGKMLDLNDLIANPIPGFTLEDALGISDTGYITGDMSVGPNEPTHAFLLTPTAIPEPSALVLLGTGAVGLLGYGALRRSRRSRSPCPSPFRWPAPPRSTSGVGSIRRAWSSSGRTTCRSSSSTG
jgi:probable HAF family extracellular repeat protein